ncbi:hypothetical protein [Paraburkholderia sp. ZP32-5]|nr:hypothetical protein [Paraburkholderia sp. ZP32-5]
MSEIIFHPLFFDFVVTGRHVIAPHFVDVAPHRQAQRQRASK